MPANMSSPVDKNVPGYVEKLTWLESLEAPSDQRSRRLAARAWGGLWPIGLAILIVLAVWQLIHLSGWKKAIFPGPGATLSNLWDQLQTGLLWQAIATTAQRAIIGFALAVLIGAVGYLMIYASLITLSIRNGVILPIVLYALAICLFLFLCLVGILSNLKNAKVHWVIEISNVVCQCSVAVATVILMCR